MNGTDYLDLLFLAIVGGPALWAIGIGLRRLVLRNPELDWAQVPGRIRISGVDVEDLGDGNAYSLVVEYEYEYRGVRYLGDRIAPIGHWGAFRFSAETSARRYPVGREVTVYVNQRNPGQAVLEPARQPYQALCYCLVGGGALTLAYMFWFPR